MTRPVISVCVATYNQRNLIGVCLRSILDQQVDADVRVLVGDDASTDGTSEVIQALVYEYGDRLSHYRRTTNMGAAANMCDILARAEGDFIARVDGDDYWLPGKLARQLACYKENPRCGAVYTNALTVDETGNPVGLFNDVGDVHIDLAALLRRGNFLNNSSVLFRAEDVHGWMEIVDQIDYQVHLWLANKGGLVQIAEPLAAYRINTPGSMISTANDHVRQLYWQAIQSVPRNRVSDADYAHGLADFLRRIFFRAVRTRDVGLYRAWAVRIHAASPYGFLPTTCLVAANIARMCLKMTIGQLRPSARRNVLYRR